MTFSQENLNLFGLFAIACHLLGFLSATQAIVKARTAQGATAWAIFLVSFPYLALPLYWLFGRERFNGYVVSRKGKLEELTHFRKFLAPLPSSYSAQYSVLEKLVQLPFNGGNDAELYINGQATFDAIFEGIDSAKKYLLVQFYIVRDDELGRAFRAKLLQAAARGVRIYFLYDPIGCYWLSNKYLTQMSNAGIHVSGFKTAKGAWNRFQVNFRNHRKIVITDGKVAFVGGHNVGDEYLGKDKKFGEWRDTHVRVSGPAVGQIQLCFLEDWRWTSDFLPELDWEFKAAAVPGKSVLVLPTGPADSLDSCCLFFLEAINSAQRRIWITSPYFVPDQRIVAALQLAAMRGVEIKILIPNMADHLFVYLASFAFLKDTLPWNIQLFRYQGGFIHEKVLLVDDELSAVGTANFDNRSFRLNFELTLLFADSTFSKQVEQMLMDDFLRSKPVTMGEFEDRSYLFKLSVHFSRLLAPIL